MFISESMRKGRCALPKSWLREMRWLGDVGSPSEELGFGGGRRAAWSALLRVRHSSFSCHPEGGRQPCVSGCRCLGQAREPVSFQSSFASLLSTPGLKPNFLRSQEKRQPHTLPESLVPAEGQLIQNQKSWAPLDWL